MANPQLIVYSGKQTIVPLINHDLFGGYNIPDEIYQLLIQGQEVEHRSVITTDERTICEHWSAEAAPDRDSCLALQTSTLLHSSELEIQNRHLLTRVTIATSMFVPASTWTDVKQLKDRHLMRSILAPELADLPMKGWVTRIDMEVRSTQ